ncbi:MAG: phosphonate lyase system protein PhnG [Pseudomonadota bacterium]|jgi:alpha-D-ribose 1-methylphosphonate 5-triphosphate synthase subunit PhnG
MPIPDTDTTARRDWLSLLSRAPADRLAALFPDPLPDHALLRAPEIGSVMVRGRTGGTGAPFNLGEMTVTRCSLRLADGTVGHAYVQGRDRSHALRAATLDALMQTDAAPDLRRRCLDPLAQEETARRAARAAKAAATKVDFFTMVRGEDK